MATNADNNANKLTTEERTTCIAGIDALIASQGRMAAREQNPRIKQIREAENERLLKLKYRLQQKELEL